MWDSYYLWLKALHILAVMAWMAGLLYLPRLFVYHSMQPAGSDAARMLMVMEKRLLRYIMTPAMIASFVFGVLLIVETGLGAPGSAKWIHAKIGLVLILAGLHGWMARHRRAFAEGRNTHSPRYFRIFNELPTLCMIGIVILAVLKPF